MQLDKNMILDLLRERGQGDQASQAEQELPDQVDTDKDGGLLQKFGLDPQEPSSELRQDPGRAPGGTRLPRCGRLRRRPGGR